VLMSVRYYDRYCMGMLGPSHLRFFDVDVHCYSAEVATFASND
jgi:hypothetical protein